MKVCTFSFDTLIGPQKRLGILQDDNSVVDVNLVWQKQYQKQGLFNYTDRANARMPSSLHSLLALSDSPIELLQETLSIFSKLEKSGDIQAFQPDNVSLNAPLDKITTYRDFYAHEKHVAKGFEKRKEPIPEAWYEFPAYYKGATAGFIGPNEEILWPSYTKILDYELELAVVMGSDAKNIKAKDATKKIFGYTILNDISARDIQKKEMAIKLGPAKGKDFCSIIGPVITTMDEFNYQEPDLVMTATINGEEWSRGQSGDSHYSFSEMIEHVAKDEWILAGDLLGSGTVGTGCGLEIDKWIQPGDTIDLFVDKIGHLVNKVGGPTNG